eukprot:587341-Pleurochrysis_carterae.AAC.2
MSIDLAAGNPADNGVSLCVQPWAPAPQDYSSRSDSESSEKDLNPESPLRREERECAGYFEWETRAALRIKPRQRRQWLEYCERNDLYAGPPSPDPAHAIEQGFPDTDARNEDPKQIEQANEAKALSLFGFARHGWEARD